MALGSLGKLFVEIGADTSGLDAGLSGAESKVSGFGDKLKASGKAVGTGMTAAGAGIMVLTDSSMKTNAALGTTALQLGITTGEMRELALETANVTFPLSEVKTSFDLLTRAGMTNVDQIAASATAFDTLGDAIGLPASEVTNLLIPAFNAFEIPLEDAAKHTDTFTHLMRNTTVELSDFSGMLNYLAADLSTMDISMVESVAVMEALADKGIQGSAATREFRTAVSGADGDITLFYEALGLTAEEVEGYAGNIEGATGMTQAFADAQNKQFTTMDKLKHSIGEATLQYGSFLEPIEALGPIMTTLGPLMIVASTANWAHAASAWAMIAPYLAIAAPILAVIAILYILEAKFGVLTTAFEIGKAAGEAFSNWLSTAIPAAIEVAKAMISGLIEFVSGLGDKLLFLLGPVGAVIYAFRNWNEIKSIVSGVVGSIVSQVKDRLSSMISFITGLAGRFRSAGKAIMNALKNGILSGISAAVAAVRRAAAKLRSYLPGSDAKVGPLSDLMASGEALMTTFEKGMEGSGVDLSGTMEHVLPNPATLQAAAPASSSGSRGGAISNSSSISIGEVHLSKDYDFEQLMKDIERHQAGQRMQRGYSAI